MCKILVLTDTSKIKGKKHVVETIAEHLLSDQRDGFGYAMLGSSGVYGERTTKTTFETRFGADTFKLEVKDDIFEKTYNRFGTIGTCSGGAIFHGRTSTNDKGIINTHPIIKDNWTLIHNGVVTNHGDKYEKMTTNDTEDLVHYLSTTGIEGIEKNISGYYAIGAFDPQGNLHVIKDSTASLYVAVNKTLDCHIFATTELLIKEVAKDCSWKIGPIEKVKNDIHLIYDKTGALISNKSISPRGYGYDESRWASESLGYKVLDYTKHRREKSESSYYPYSYNIEDDDYETIEETNLKGYTFYDWEGNELTYKQFMTLDEVTKETCYVYRKDGTTVDKHDYYTEKLN